MKVLKGTDQQKKGLEEQKGAMAMGPERRSVGAKSSLRCAEKTKTGARREGEIRQ